MADKQISQLVAATTVNDEDLLVMQQGGTAKKLSGRTLGDYVYSAAAEKIAEVEQMIAGVEEDMTATTNYTTDSLVVADNKLYKLTADVTTGQSLTPGSNCTQTTIAAVLDELRAGLGASDAGGVTYSDSETYESGSVGKKLQALDSSVATLETDVDALEEDLNTLEDTVNGSFSDSTITDVAIATFSDGVAGTNLKKITVGMSPVQDLHGYDAPWPAGGGKNLFNPNNLANGYLNSSGGFVERASAITTDYISVTPEAAYVLSSGTDTNFYTLNIAEYDSTKTWIRNNIVSSRTSFSKTLDSTASFVRLTYNLDNSTALDTSTFVNTYKPQFELGSSATSYAPYENVCPITGWTECNYGANSKNYFNPQADIGTPTGSSPLHYVPSKIYLGVHATQPERYVFPSNLSAFTKTSTGFKFTRHASNNSYGVAYVIRVREGDTLSWSATFVNAYMSGWQFYNSVWKKITSINTVTATVPSGSVFAVLTVQADTTDVEAEASNIMIYEGEAPSEYISYTGTTIPITFPALGKNLFNGVVTNQRVTENGDGTVSIVSTGSWRLTDFIPVEPGEVYAVYNEDGSYNNGSIFTTWDANKQFVGWYSSYRVNPAATIPEGVAYVRVQVSSTMYANSNGHVSVCKVTGISVSTLIPYEPYNNTVYSGTLTINEDGSGELIVDEQKLTATSYTVAGVRTDGYYCRLNVNGSYLASSNNALFKANLAKIGKYSTTTTPILEARVSSAGNSGETSTWMHLYIPNTVVDYDPEGSSTLAQCITRDLPPANWEIIVPLVEPITYHLSEQQVISVLNGENNVWADAGNIAELTYYTQAQPGIRDYIDTAYSDIEHMLSGVESEMVATRSYAEGALFVAEHKLYNATTSIASGDELIPGTNCNVTTVEAQLNAVRSSIAALDAAKVDKSAFLAAITGTYDIYPIDTLTDQVIAHFTDGANDVPVKKLVAQISPVQSGTGDPSPENVRPISGWTGCNVTGTGKNLFGGLDLGNKIYDTVPDSTIDTTAKTVTFASGKHELDNWFTEFKENTRYTFILSLSNTQDDSAATNIRVKYTDGTLANMVKSGASKQTIVYNSISGKSLEFFGYSSQIGTTTLYYDESGIFEGVLTAEDFDTYQGTTIPYAFPEEAGTVYGGTLTVNEDGSGELASGFANFVYNGNYQLNMPSVSYIGSNSTHCYLNVRDATGGRKGTNPADYCNMLVYGSTDVDGNENVFSREGGWGFHIRIQNSLTGVDSSDTVEVAKNKIAAYFAENPVQYVYELAEPITYQLTAQQVKTLLGENNIWADTGNVDVTYRADSGLYIAKKIAEAIT